MPSNIAARPCVTYLGTELSMFNPLLRRQPWPWTPPPRPEPLSCRYLRPTYRRCAPSGYRRLLSAACHGAEPLYLPVRPAGLPAGRSTLQMRCACPLRVVGSDAGENRATYCGGEWYGEGRLGVRRYCFRISSILER